MTTKTDLKGVICAVATPMRGGQVAVDNLQRHLRTLEAEGCDGALVLGTTGEGTSLSREQRDTVIQAAAEAKGSMTLLAGTGSPSLAETIWLTQRAFALGVDGVLTLPPYYFKNPSVSGLTGFYRAVLDEAVPADKLLLAYHIPKVAGVGVPFEVMAALADYAPERFVGVKDSTGDWEHGQALCQQFPDLRVFLGNDNLFLKGLQAGAAGGITAANNLFAPLAAEVYRLFTSGQDASAAQERLSLARTTFERFAPAPSAIKHLLALRHGGDGWEVVPPLEPLTATVQGELLTALAALDLGEALAWLREVALANV